MASAEIDSTSAGDPSRFLPPDVLEAQLNALPAAPPNEGRVVCLISRGDGGRRIRLDRATMTPDSGMPGDAWGRQRRSNPNAQLTRHRNLRGVYMRVVEAGEIAAGDSVIVIARRTAALV